MSSSLSLSYDRASILIKGCPPSTPLFAKLLRLGAKVDPRLGGILRAEAIHYRPLLTLLTREKVSFEDRVRNYQNLELDFHLKHAPYAHQKGAFEAWKKAYQRGVVVLPTGSGKSLVALLATAEVKRSTLIVTPTIDLMNQWAKLLTEAFSGDFKIGTLGGGQQEIEALTVTTYDSLYIHIERLSHRFGLVIFDECHHLPSPSYSQAAMGLIAPYRMGLTATPERSDGGERSLHHLIGPTVFRENIQDLEGFVLAPYEVIQLMASMDEEEKEAYLEARALYRDFVESNGISMRQPSGWSQFLALSARSIEGRQAFLAWREQRNLAMKPKAKLDILEGLLLKHALDPMIIFCADNELVFQISKTYLIPSLTQHTKAGERRYILEAFNDGKLNALVTARVLNEGIDLPRAEIAVILAGSSTVTEHVQRLGRILRKRGDKKATLYEIVTEDSSEVFMSQRRKDHGAYQR